MLLKFNRWLLSDTEYAIMQEPIPASMPTCTIYCKVPALEGGLDSMVS